MGILHRTYPFGYAGLAKLVLSLTSLSAGDFAEKLLYQANRAVTNPTSAGREFLTDISYDIEWAESLDQDINYVPDWFMALFASLVVRCDDLPYASFATIRGALPILGWDPEDISLLLTGRPIYELVGSLEQPALLSNFNPATKIFGWLPAAEARDLVGKLNTVESSFLDPCGQLLKIAKGMSFGLPTSKTSLTQHLRHAFTACKRRLKPGTEQHHDLLFYNEH